MLLQCLQELLDIGVDAEVDDLEPGAFHHHRHQVLADVVDVALNRPDDNSPDRLGAGLRQQGPQHCHTGLHGVGRHQHLGDEQDAVPEVDAHDAHPLDQRVVEHVGSGPAPLQEDARSLVDLFVETVVEVIVHLLDELVIGEGS